MCGGCVGCVGFFFHGWVAMIFPPFTCHAGLRVFLRQGTWTAGPSLVLPRADKAMVVVGGFPYVLGGETTSDNAGAVPVKDIEVLANPAIGWEQDPSGELDLHKFRFSAVE